MENRSLSRKGAAYVTNEETAFPPHPAQLVIDLIIRNKIMQTRGCKFQKKFRAE